MTAPDLSPCERTVTGFVRRRRWPHAVLRGDGALLAGWPSPAYWRRELRNLRPERKGGGLTVRWPRGIKGSLFRISGGRWLMVGPFRHGKAGPDPAMLDLVGGIIQDNLALSEALYQKMHALEAVLHLGATFASIKDIEELVSSKMVHEVIQLLNADRGTVYLLDDARKEIYSLVAVGAGYQEIRFPIDRGISGFVARTGRVVNIKDAHRDARFNPDYDRRTGYRTKSVLAAPMNNPQGQRIGVIQVINKKDAESFSKEDEEFLRTIAAEAATAIINVQLVEEQKNLAVSMITSLAAALDARDTLTAGHSHRVATYAFGVARHMGIQKPELERIRMAGLMHDLGKIGVPDSILKKAGNLTPEEYETIKKHAGHTRTILREIRLPGDLSGLPDEAGGHHERMDGSGYPDNLPGEKIPLAARILAVADVFDAITSKRTYREAMPIDEALAVIRNGKGRHFSADCVEAFFRYFEAELKDRWPKRGGGDQIIKSSDPARN